MLACPPCGQRDLLSASVECRAAAVIDSVDDRFGSIHVAPRYQSEVRIVVVAPDIKSWMLWCTAHKRRAGGLRAVSSLLGLTLKCAELRPRIAVRRC
jgi:hypothetical protein